MGRRRMKREVWVGGKDKEDEDGDDEGRREG